MSHNSKNSWGHNLGILLGLLTDLSEQIKLYDTYKQTTNFEETTTESYGDYNELWLILRIYYEKFCQLIFGNKGKPANFIETTTRHYSIILR